MKSQKNELCTLSENQTNPYLATGSDFQITHDEFDDYGEFGGQCGASKAEYEKLIAHGKRAANASNFAEVAEVHPNVDDAYAPKTPGFSRK